MSTYIRTHMNMYTHALIHTYTPYIHTHTCAHARTYTLHIRKIFMVLDTLMTLWLYRLMHFRNLFWRIWEWNVIVSAICFKIFQEKIEEVSNTKWKRFLSLHGRIWVLIIPFLPFSRFQNGHNKKEKPKERLGPVCVWWVGNEWHIAWLWSLEQWLWFLLRLWPCTEGAMWHSGNH